MTPHDRAAHLIHLLRDRAETLAAAESLTGGMFGAALTSVPGASVVFRGGVVAYSTDMKERLLGVPHHVINHAGAVSEEAAAAMADGVRRLFDATYGVSLTGVAGPDLQEGKPPGLVYVGVSSPRGERVEKVQLIGERDAVRASAVDAALALITQAATE